MKPQKPQRTDPPPSDLVVFITRRDSRCDECGTELGRSAWIMLRGKEQGAACLSCADLDHLAFLPSGDTALTRRARKHSGLSAVVVKWSQARKRYERQGILVEEEALAKAEQECEADAPAREERQRRAAEHRAELDEGFVQQFATRVRELFPGAPKGREHEIAAHACRKYSGRVGRSAAAKELDEDAVRLAVAAHVRHRETGYDTLMMRGRDRFEARGVVRDQVEGILRLWAQVGSPPKTARTPRRANFKK